MASRSHEELGVEWLAYLMEGLLRGKGVSLRDLVPGLPEGVLWSKRSGVSLTEAILLTGPPFIPAIEEESGLRLRDLIKLHREELARVVADRRLDVADIPFPLKKVVLFSLAWLMLNASKRGDKLPVEEIRALYLTLMRNYQRRWGKFAREAFSLMALGLEPFLISIKSDPSLLVRMVLHPVALAGSIMAYLPADRRGEAWELVAPKLLKLRDEFCIDLPSPKQDSIDLLKFAQELGETYKELRTVILLVMRRLSMARAPERINMGEILDQLSSELEDWSRRRKVRLLGAKLRRKVLRFYALYPAAPELWLAQQERRGFARVGRGSKVSAIPWPFRERGVSFLSLELLGVQN